MDTKVLLTGIVSFIAGALLVAIAATSFEKPVDRGTSEQSMVDGLKGKTGDDFDKVFLSGMIMHHQDAVDMARMAETQAGHNEIKMLSKDIIAAQNKEINDMKQWQAEWGFTSGGAKMNH